MKVHAFSKLLPVLLVSSRTLAQQAGTLSEDKPTITLKECTLAGGCTSRQAKLTLDANWRWIHEVGGYENCYTGDKWDGGICSDPTQCAQNCGEYAILRLHESLWDMVSRCTLLTHSHASKSDSLLQRLRESRGSSMKIRTESSKSKMACA